MFNELISECDSFHFDLSSLFTIPPKYKKNTVLSSKFNNNKTDMKKSIVYNFSTICLNSSRMKFFFLSFFHFRTTEQINKFYATTHGRESRPCCSTKFQNSRAEYNQELRSHNPMNYSNHYSVTIRVTYDTPRDLIGNKHAAAQSLPSTTPLLPTPKCNTVVMTIVAQLNDI